MWKKQSYFVLSVQIIRHSELRVCIYFDVRLLFYKSYGTLYRHIMHMKVYISLWLLVQKDSSGMFCFMLNVMHVF